MNRYTEEQITAGLMAVISWAGNATAAAEALRATKPEMDLSAGTLSRWAKDTYATRYQEMREKYAEQLEQQLIGDMRDVAMYAVSVERAGLEKAMERLERGSDQDPSRTAANAATVADKMAGKMLALSGRPTSIREDRNVEEIIRSLAAKGVLQLPSAEVTEEPNDGVSGQAQSPVQRGGA